MSGSSPNSIRPTPVPVGIALGSNLGNRAAEIEGGFAFLESLSVRPIRRSSIIETEPVDCPPGSACFLNAVAELQVDPQVAPRTLLEGLKAYERRRGRPDRRLLYAPRPLDLDILYFGELVLREGDLVIPHPRLASRTFVLQPLAELRPDLILPGQTRPVRELLAAGAKG